MAGPIHDQWSDRRASAHAPGGSDAAAGSPAYAPARSASPRVRQPDRYPVRVRGRTTHVGYRGETRGAHSPDDSRIVERFTNLPSRLELSAVSSVRARAPRASEASISR